MVNAKREENDLRFKSIRKIIDKNSKRKRSIAVILKT